MRRGYEPKITSPTESNFAIGDNEDDDSIDMRETRAQVSTIAFRLSSDLSAYDK